MGLNGLVIAHERKELAMAKSIIRCPGIQDPKDKYAEHTEKKIRKALGDTPTAEILGKLAKVYIWSVPT